MKTNPYLTDFYSHYDEDERLASRHGSVEFLTTMRYIEKYIRPQDRVLEIGAGTGRYSHALDPESGPFPDVSERNGPKVQAGLQRNVHFRLGNGNRQRRRSPGKHGDALQPQLNALRRLFRRRKDAAGLHRIRFLQLL